MGWYTQERVDLRFKAGDLVYNYAILNQKPVITPVIQKVVQVRTLATSGFPIHLVDVTMEGWKSSLAPHKVTFYVTTKKKTDWYGSLEHSSGPRICCLSNLDGVASHHKKDYLLLWPLPDLEWLEMTAALDGEESNANRLWENVLANKDKLQSYKPRKEHADPRLYLPLMQDNSVGSGGEHPNYPF